MNLQSGEKYERQRKHLEQLYRQNSSTHHLKQKVISSVVLSPQKNLSSIILAGVVKSILLLVGIVFVQLGLRFFFRNFY